MNAIAQPQLSHPPSGRRQHTAVRQCAFEALEPRMLLAADAVPPVLSLPGGQDSTLSGHVFEVAMLKVGTNEFTSQSLPAARVQLLSASGKLIEETLTAEDGSYRFEGLVAGEYAVRQLLPLGYTVFEVNPGSGGGTPLAANSVTEITLDWGEDFVDYDFLLQVVNQSQQALDSPSPGELSLSLQNATGRPIPSHIWSSQPAAIHASQVAAPELVDPLVPSRQAEFYGGSCQRQRESQELRLELDLPADELFRLTDYLQIVSNDSMQLEDLLPIFEQEQISADQDQTADAAHDEIAKISRRSDVGMAEQTTSKRVDASTATPPVPRVARRPKAKASEAELPKKPTNKEGRTAESKRVAAIDRALETALTAARIAQPG